jgi:hypothetical protein
MRSSPGGRLELEVLVERVGDVAAHVEPGSLGCHVHLDKSSVSPLWVLTLARASVLSCFRPTISSAVRVFYIR